MYYIYHIPGKKIGCTHNIKSRLKKYRPEGIFNFDILETHTDIYIASNRELELQKEYGYTIDRVPYYHSKKMQVKGRSVGGIVGGKSAVDSGQLKDARKLAHQKSNHSKYTCPHCNKEGQYRAMKRWHGDNCSQNK
jgi:ribosomal protein L37AE/L43A